MKIRNHVYFTYLWNPLRSALFNVGPIDHTTVMSVFQPSEQFRNYLQHEFQPEAHCSTENLIYFFEHSLCPSVFKAALAEQGSLC